MYLGIVQYFWIHMLASSITKVSKLMKEHKRQVASDKCQVTRVRAEEKENRM
jgi:hypothetical protein